MVQLRAEIQKTKKLDLIGATMLSLSKDGYLVLQLECRFEWLGEGQEKQQRMDPSKLLEACCSE